MSSSRTTDLRRNMSRKLSRVYQRQTPVHSEDPGDVSIDSGAGPSNSYAEQPLEEEVPTSPTTEFPDSYGAFLPGYFEDPREDPNAHHAWPVEVPSHQPEVDYTAPPPEESYEPSLNDGPRYQINSVDSGSSIMDRWRSANADLESGKPSSVQPQIMNWLISLCCRR